MQQSDRDSASRPAGPQGPVVAMLMPHFPSQTHTFFWREILALREMGVQVRTVSTTHPPAGECCHEWAQQAARETLYLFPPSAKDLAWAMGRLASGGPRRWLEATLTPARLDGAAALHRARAAMLAVLASSLAARAQREGWTHLHAHSCGDVALLAMLAASMARLPYSLTLHGPLEHYGPGQRLKWRRASFAITVSEKLQREVLEQIPGLDRSRIEVAPMGVDLAQWVRRAPYQPPAKGGAWRLVSCGRLHRAKGHAEVVRAVALLRERGRDVRLTILGEGPARGELEALIAELKLGYSVELRGAVREGAVRQTLEASHLFVLASHDEAVGVATMEAMAMALPVVVTDVGGVAELVEQGVTGEMVPPKAPEQLAAAVERVLLYPQRALELGEAGRRRVVERFDCRRSAGVIASRLGIDACDDGRSALAGVTPPLARAPAGAA